MGVFNSAQSRAVFVLIMLGSSLGYAYGDCKYSNNTNADGFNGYSIRCPGNEDLLQGVNPCSGSKIVFNNVDQMKKYCVIPSSGTSTDPVTGNAGMLFYSCPSGWVMDGLSADGSARPLHTDNSTGVCDSGKNATGGTAGTPSAGATQEVIDACMTARNDVQNGSGGCEAANNSKTVAYVNAGQAALGFATNPTFACSQLKTLAGSTNVAISAFQASCQMTAGTCIDSCTAPSGVTPDSTMISNLAYCNKVNAAVASSLPNMVQSALGMTAQQSAQCDNLLNGLSAQCAANPMAPGCPGYVAGDCSNPMNASSAACSGGINPNMDPNGAPVGAVAGAGSAAGIGGPGGGFTDALPSALLDDPSKLDAAKNAGNNGPGRGGGGGGAGLGGHGTDAPVVAKAKSGAARGDNKPGSMYGGLLTSNNGGFGVSKSGAGYGDGKGGASGRTLFGAQYAVGQKVPLNQFLPNGKFNPHRSIAGTTGPDGITGPDSNLFEKVKTQYTQQFSKGAFLNQ